jgi:hypothetical protein
MTSPGQARVLTRPDTPARPRPGDNETPANGSAAIVKSAAARLQADYPLSTSTIVLPRAAGLAAT